MALISLRQLLDHAAEHSYGLPAFNINNMEQILSIMKAADEVDSPVILQASAGARGYAGESFFAQNGRGGDRAISAYSDLHASRPWRLAQSLPDGDS